MAASARFQRLDSSEDITGSNDRDYQSNTRFYDEPESMNPAQVLPQMHNPQQSPHMYNPHQSAHVYSSEDQRRMSYTTRKPVGRASQSQTPTPDQPLMDNYFNTTRSISSISENPFADPNPRKRSSNISNKAASLWSRARGRHVDQHSTPLFAAPWRHEPCHDLGSARASTVRFFNRKKQQNRIFFHFFLQLLIPLAFCGALVGTLYFYSSKPKVSNKEKYMFNSLMLGFSLCLGFAIVGGLKEYANIFRWRLLAGRYRSLQQFELILGLASQRKALRLLWVGRTEGSILPNGTQLLCFLYILFAIGLQIVIALLGLCYSVDAADNQVDTVTGNVSIANLAYIQQTEVYNPSLDQFQLQSGAVNAYGIAGQRFGITYTDVTDNSTSGGSFEPLYTDNSTMWWYWFIDQCAAENCNTQFVTNRYVYANATCFQYTVTGGGFVDSGNVSFIDQNGNHEYVGYFGSETVATTTWYSRIPNSCGDRCTSLFVLNVGYDGSSANTASWQPQFFQCNNTVSAVTDNRTLSAAYSLPDEQARLVAGAIGYNGASWAEENKIYQARTYDIGSLWSWTRLNGAGFSTKDVANLIMHFSMGAVAAMDAGGPRQFVIGEAPVIPQQVNVLWMWAIVVLIAVPSVQFLLLIITTIWGNTAIVKDDSFLSAATLLRPVIERLERSGCALSGDEICEVLGNPSIAYGVRMPHGSSAYGGMAKGNDEVMHLDILLEGENYNRPSDMGWRLGMTMPQGRYDGIKDKTEVRALWEARTSAREKTKDIKSW